MTGVLFDVIPAERRETARAALADAFGTAPPTALRPVTGGASGALTYRVEVGGRPYLMRLEPPPGPMRDPQRAYACMRAAADAGIAPPLHYADPTAGVAIMDFLTERPLSDYPGGPEGLVRGLGGLIARLQATPIFPPLGGYLVVLGRMLAYLRGSGRFAAGKLDPHQEGFERIREAYPWDGSALVSSHNDPNPRNILFDGERLWLIDWETAYRNDPLVDVAILADNFAATPELETMLLRTWLGRAADRVLRARLTLMRQLTNLYYASLLLSLSTAGGGGPETDLAALSVAEFHAGFAQGRIVAGAPETLYILGKMKLCAFLAGLSAPGFDEALVIARRG